MKQLEGRINNQISLVKGLIHSVNGVNLGVIIDCVVFLSR